MAEAPAASADQQLKQRAMRRLAVPGALIALAVVGLAVLDHYSSSRRVSVPQAPDSEPPAIANLPPPKPIAPPSTQPASSAERAEVLPPPPSVAAVPAAPGARPMQTTPGAKPTLPAQVMPEETTAPQPDSASAPLRPAGRSGPQTTAIGASLIAPGFVVQLGMFSSVENAQALRAKLEARGIPVFLETRVVVGPFRDRAEADVAYKKLKTLGVSGVIAQRK